MHADKAIDVMVKSIPLYREGSVHCWLHPFLLENKRSPESSEIPKSFARVYLSDVEYDQNSFIDAQRIQKEITEIMATYFDRQDWAMIGEYLVFTLESEAALFRLLTSEILR